jgi:hypothetical protein
VAGWQWDIRHGCGMGIILSGDKLGIGAVLTVLWCFFFFLFFFFFEGTPYFLTLWRGDCWEKGTG